MAEADHQNSAALYNEVVLDGASIAADPAHAVAAFVYQEQTLRPWENHGVNPSLARATSARDAFLRAYALGCAQMYVFSGGGLQALMSGLRRRGVFATMAPDDDRCRDGSLHGQPELLEKVIGLEMSRRAFTNVCNIMSRHRFVAHWARWRHQTGRPPLPGVVV